MPSAPSRAKTLAAFAIIYFVWGATFLAIKTAVHAEPPLLVAGVRFTAAGLLLFGWCLLRREALPTAAQWRSLALLAGLIFVADYGFLFWAEQRVPSGLAAVMLATIPSFLAVAEILLLGTRRMTVRLAFALGVGLAGVAALVGHRAGSSAPVQTAGAAALVLAAVAWSVASVLSRRLPLPASKPLSSALQMVLGGLMLLALSCALREPARFQAANLTPRFWGAMAYLVFFGSILGFTAYVWLIEHQSPTIVGTYAYINPLVAVLIGHFVAAEPLGLRALLGSAAVLLSVIVLTTAPKSAPLPAEEP